MTEKLLTEREGGVVTLILNNPEKRNALTLETFKKLPYVLAPLAMDETVRCLVLRGSGQEAFAAGADIAEFPDVRANAEQAAQYTEATAMALETITHFPHPTVAAIQGFCMGGGLEIAACCDIRVANTSAKFGVPINRIGHPFAYPELEAVLNVAGRAVILDLLLTGRAIGSEEALRLGLVSQVFADADFEAEAAKLVARIAAAAPLSNRYTKKFVNRLTTDPAPLTADEIAESYAPCDSEDYTEGFTAFLEKRPAQFKGR